MIELGKGSTSHYLKTIGYTVAALIAFAANSVLCRLAIKDNMIDPSSFTLIRLLSGVLMFAIILRLKSAYTSDTPVYKNGSWKAALMLFLYALTFSFAYISLDTGTGALVLFGAVQLTMIASAIISGNKVRFSEWLGILISFSGLVYLVYPTITTPSIFGFVLMIMSGIAWGIYTIFGRGSANPFRDTAFNFKLTMPFVLVLAIVAIPSINISFEGLVLAVLSGAFASAIGYTIWYIALGRLSVIEAAVVQLSVPVFAAAGGILFVSETITARLILSSILVLGGILIVVLGKYKFAKA